MALVRKTLAERFWEKVNKNGPIPEHRPELGPCWVWTASCYKNGYGQFGVKAGMIVPAHRVSWMLTHGPIPDGLFVCHHCDNHLCVNPSHLFTGTPADNVRDMLAKDRQVKKENHWSHLHPEKRAVGSRHGSRTHPESVSHGMGHYFAKLDDEKVRDMRERYAAGGISQYQLAAEYGVNQSIVSEIIQRKRWRHVG